MTSALDEHEEAGEFAFAVDTAGRLPAVRTAGRIAWPQAVAGWAALTGLLLAFGGLITRWRVWDQVSKSYGTREPASLLPGSWIWLRMETDGVGRLLEETIVSPGHRIERRFR